MGTGAGDIWWGFTHGARLAHERRMQLLDVAWADPEQLLLFAPLAATRDALVALFAIGILVITLGYAFLVARQDPGRAIVHKMDQRVQFEGRSLPAQ